MHQVEFASLQFQKPYFQSATATTALINPDTNLPSDGFYDFYEKVACSNPGMIIIQHAFVEPRGRADVRQLSIADDECIPVHTRLLERIRSVDPQIVVCSQIAHAGPLAFGHPKCDINEMSPQDIEFVIQSFVDAAIRAKNCGYDCVQVHAAHTYLLSRSISPYYNKREDEYAYDTYYCLRQIQSRIRKLAPNLPLGIKLQAEEFMQGEGITAEHTVAFLRKMHFDFVEISGGARGGKYPTIRPGKDVFYYKHVIERLVAENMMHSQNILVTGGFENVDHAQQALNMGCKMVGFSRKFLRNPTFLVKDDKSCVRCSQCASNGGICILVQKGL